jgi:hypothetical protein
MKNTDNQALELIKDLSSNGKQKAEIYNQLVNKFGYKKTKSYSLINKVMTTTNKATTTTGTVKYRYDQKRDLYIFNTKYTKTGIIEVKPEVITKLDVELFSKSTYHQMSMSVNLEIGIIKEILTALNKVKNELPLSEEIIATGDVNAGVQKLQELEKGAYKLQVEKEYVKHELVKAKKFTSLTHGLFDPLKEYIDSMKPRKIELIERLPGLPKSEDRAFVFCAFDWHIGAVAEKIKQHEGDDWDIKIATKCIQKIKAEIAARVANDAAGFGTGIVLFGGDLYHTLTGFTANNTDLSRSVERFGMKQFDATFNLCCEVVDLMLQLFPKVEVHFVEGNHGGLTDNLLGRLIEANYTNSRFQHPRIKFQVGLEPHKVVTFGSTLILFGHGASAKCKAVTPIKGSAQTEWISNLLISLGKEGKLTGKKSILYVQGDRHHFEHKDKGHYDIILCGSLPVGDEFADSNNYRSTPKQNCLILGPSGYENTAHLNLK